MINLKKTFEFLNTNNLTFEELGILLTFYYRNNSAEISMQAKQYYKKENTLLYLDKKTGIKCPFQFKDATERLIDKGLLEDYRNEKDKKDVNNIYLDKLKVTDKFIEMYFVKKEDAYDYLLSLYPDWLMINGKKVPTKTVDHAKYKELVYNTILEGGNKEIYDFFCYMLKELFDYTFTYNEYNIPIEGKPCKMAEMKWDKFLLSYDAIAKDFKDNGEVNFNNLV